MRQDVIYPQLNQDNVRRWVEALESGRYPQTSRSLEEVDETGEPVGYCCLGVACVVAMVNGADITRTVDADNGSVSYNGSSDYLPLEVQAWLGLQSAGWASSSFNPYIGNYRASDLNDNYNMSFRDIARNIRRRWLDEDV